VQTSAHLSGIITHSTFHGSQKHPPEAKVSSKIHDVINAGRISRFQMLSVAAQGVGQFAPQVLGRIGIGGILASISVITTAGGCR